MLCVSETEYLDMLDLEEGAYIASMRSKGDIIRSNLWMDSCCCFCTDSAGLRILSVGIERIGWGILNVEMK